MPSAKMRFLGPEQVYTVDGHKAFRRYRDHIRPFWERIPKPLRLLCAGMLDYTQFPEGAEMWCIHDAGILDWDHDARKRVLVATLLIEPYEDPQHPKCGEGPNKIRVRYSGVDSVIGDERVHEYRNLPQGRGDLMNHEVDIINGGRFVHRLLFACDDVIIITFTGFEVEVVEP